MVFRDAWGTVVSMRKKRIAILGVLLSAVFVAEASDRLLESLTPQQGRAVYDYANVISSGDEQQLESMTAEVRQKTGASIVVVTLQSLEGGEIDDFTNRLFEKWGVGQAGKDNGLMFLAAMQERVMRIEVGYGLEGAIPDSVAGRIRRDIITPYFQAGQTGQGILAGVAALSQEIAEEYGVELTGAATQVRYPRNARSSEDGGIPIIPLILLILFIPFAIRHPFLAMMLLSGGRGGGYHTGGGFSSGGFGGGGGFGGFSGGMSGGGGSSGGW